MTTEKTHLFVPIEPSADHTRVGFQRKALADCTDAEKLVVQQLKDHKISLLTSSPISNETLVSQLKTYLEGIK